MQDQMKEVVKNKAISLLKLDTKVTEASAAIDNGDTNLFFLSMFGKDVMLKAKLIMSLQTTFGMSFYEQISKSLGEMAGYQVENQYKLSGYISESAQNYLYKTLEDNNYEPDRVAEYAELSSLYADDLSKGLILEPRYMPDSTVDVFIKKPDGTEVFIDITTVKPNKKEFRTLKQKILAWYFMRLSHGDILPGKIQTFIAIPYNPEAQDNTYTRWGKYYDRNDLLVGDELWRLVSNNQFTLQDMLDIFDELGETYQEKLQAVFTK